MEAMKLKVIAIVLGMSDTEINALWEYLRKNQAPAWEEIPEEAPDAWDIEMLREAAEDPDCHEFYSEAETKRLLEL